MTGRFDDDEFDDFSVPAWPRNQQKQKQKQQQQQLNVQLNSSFVLPPPEDDSMWDTAEVDALEIDSEFDHNNKNNRRRNNNNNLLSSSSNDLCVTKTASITPRKVKPQVVNATAATIDKFHKSFGDFPDMISIDSPTATTVSDDDVGSNFHKSFTIGTMPLSAGGMKNKQLLEPPTTKRRGSKRNSGTKKIVDTSQLIGGFDGSYIEDKYAEDYKDGGDNTDSRGRRSRSRSRGRDKATVSRSQSRTRERSESRDPKKKSSSNAKKQRDRSREPRTTDTGDGSEKPKRKGRRSRSRGPLDGSTKKDSKSSTIDSNTNDTSDKKRRSRSSRRSRSPGPLRKDGEKSSRRSKSPGALKKNRDKSSRRSKSPGPITKDRDRSSRRSKSPGPLKKDRDRSSRRERSLGPVTKDRERPSRRERSLGPLTKDRERSSSPRSNRERGQRDPSMSLLSPQKRNKARKDAGSSTLQRSKSIADPSTCFHASIGDLGALGIDLSELIDGGGNADAAKPAAKLPPSRPRNLSRTKSMNENAIRLKNRALDSGLDYVDHNDLSHKRTTGRRDEKSYGSGSRSSKSSKRSSNVDGRPSSNCNEPRPLYRRKSHLDTKLGRVDQKSGFIQHQGNGSEERSIFSSDSSGSRRRRDKKGESSMRSRRTSFEDGSMTSSQADDHVKVAREMRKAEEARLKRLKEESKLLEEKRLTEETRLKALQEESRILELRSIEQRLHLPPAFQAIVDCLEPHKI
mmetsp:Transcript_17201/g.41767  ORF Transcript_17201/g.41767 Transcript_17201/m.41767 type:complete len:740 (+) Transcript_17201:199-2418(+)